MVDGFIDTSALARNYISTELESRRVRALIADPRPTISISALTIVEMAGLMARRQRDGSMSEATAERLAAEFSDDITRRYEVLGLGPAVIAGAAALVQRHALRSLDAIQVAAAIALRDQSLSQLQFWTADRRQAVAAEAEGLEVVLLGAGRR